MNDQQIRLLFETLGTEGVAALRAALTGVKTEGDAVEEELDQVGAAEAEMGLRAEAAANQVKKATQSVAEHASGQSLLQQRLTAGSYALQDFTSVGGDLGQKLNAITNNIPQLLAGLGGISTAVSVAVVAAVALYRNWDSIAGLFENRRPFPQQTEDLKGLEEQLRANEKALDDLKKAGTLNNTQMEEANRLITQQTELEAKLAMARETEANKKRLGPMAGEAAKDIKEGVEKAIMGQGGYQAVVDRLTELGMKMDPTATAEGVRRATEEMVNKALQGDAKMRDTMIWFSEQMDKTGITGTLGAELTRLSPEKTKWAQAKAEVLTQQGAEFEKPAREELKKAQEERKQERDFDQAAADTVAKLNKEKREKAEKAEGEAFDLQAAADYKKIEEEKKRIERTVGTSWQRQFEVAMATNAANIVSGLGGVDPARLSQQLQAEMVAELRRRHATGGAALGAARGIAARGEEDLNRRAADASQTNLSIAGQTLAISRQLVGEYQRMNTVQQQLVSEAKSQQQALKASSRTRLAR